MGSTTTRARNGKRRQRPKPSVPRPKRRPLRTTGWDCSMRIDQTISGKRDRIEMELASLVAPTRNGDTIAESTAKAARRMVQRVNPQEIASLMASMASVHRIVILHRLLQGSAGYKELQTASKLKAGPLYHHVASLRLAGLIGPKARDTYELTELGATAWRVEHFVMERYLCQGGSDPAGHTS